MSDLLPRFKAGDRIVRFAPGESEHGYWAIVESVISIDEYNRLRGLPRGAGLHAYKCTPTGWCDQDGHYIHSAAVPDGHVVSESEFVTHELIKRRYMLCVGGVAHGEARRMSKRMTANRANDSAFQISGETYTRIDLYLEPPGSAIPAMMRNGLGQIEDCAVTGERIKDAVGRYFADDNLQIYWQGSVFRQPSKILR